MRRSTNKVMMKRAQAKRDRASHLALPVGPRDHAQGSPRASVSLIEYSDFECPLCLRAFPIVKEVRRWLRGELRYVFRHFPLVERHPHALEAAEAVEAAGAQGRFWEMHEILCRRGPALTDLYLKCCAEAVGLDPERFEREVREHVYLVKVRDDFESGLASGVTEPPAFFINGVRYRGSADLDGLLAAIEEAGTRAISGGDTIAEIDDEDRDTS